MKKINVLVLKSYVGPFCATFFIAIFVLLLQFIWKYIDDLVGKGLDLFTLTKLMIYAAATFVPMALPLSILLSSIMSFGNLAESNELVAAKAAGISLQKIMRPLVIVAIFTCFVAFYFSNNLLPIANLKFQSLLFDIREQKPAFNIKEGIFYNEIPGIVIKVQKKDADGQNVENIMLYDHTSKYGGYSLTVASKGKMFMTDDKKNLLLNLYDGYNYFEAQNPKTKSNNSYPFERVKFSEQNLRFDMTSFSLTRTDQSLFKTSSQMQNIKQLNHTIDSIKKDDNAAMNRYVNEFFQKITFFNDNYTKKTKDTNLTNVPYKLYDIISNFKKQDRNKIYDAAINYMRGTIESVNNYKEDMDGRNKLLARNEIEWQRKFTLSFACLVLFFIGAPLGAIIRKGGFGMPVVASILLFVFFHVLSITGEKMVREGALTSLSGMWLASAVLFPFGVLLTAKATTDSVLFDKDAFVLKIKNIFKKSK